MYYLILWTNDESEKLYVEIFRNKQDRENYMLNCMTQAMPNFVTQKVLTPELLTVAIQNNEYKDPQFH